MNQLKEIDLIVHPGYSELGITNNLHPEHERVRKTWESFLRFRSMQRNYLAILFTSVKLTKIDEVNEEKLRLEEERNQLFKKILGDKLIVIHSPTGQENLPHATGEWNSLLEMHGYTFDRNRLRVNAYGALYEWCVSAWGGSFAMALDLGRKPNLIRSLSISVSQDDVFKQWQFQNWQGQEAA